MLILSNRYKVLVPIDASIAVVQGAVMFGQKPHIIDSRVMSTTYGVEAVCDFDPNIHPIVKKHVVEGVAVCTDCFVVLVREGEVVKVGQRKQFSHFRPLYRGQTGGEFNFHTSTDPKAKYTTDAAVGPLIGKVLVKSPDISKGTDRIFEVCLLFGGTEIKVTAIDRASGHTATANLDFLCKH